MANELDLMLFEQHLEELRALPEAQRLILEQRDMRMLEVFVGLHPRTAAQEHFRARLRWRDYGKPFSLKFVNLETETDNDPHAWPIFEGSRPGSLLACLPFTEEGIGLHPEWVTSPINSYVTPEAPLQFAVLMLQHLIDNGYGGRG